MLVVWLCSWALLGGRQKQSKSGCGRSANGGGKQRKRGCGRSKQQRSASEWELPMQQQSRVKRGSASRERGGLGRRPHLKFT